MDAAVIAPDGCRLGAIVPTYRHVGPLPAIVAALRGLDLPVIVVDDGNEPESAAQIARLHAPGQQVQVLRRPANGGKGAAVKAGLRMGRQLGWTHALQIDADGQHDLGDVPALIARSRARPEAVVTGVPAFDATAPRARRYGRYVTHCWVWLETLSFAISDSMCGLRVYPLAACCRILDREFLGDRMDFDIEIMVHLHWRGVPVLEHPTRVIYPAANHSNFRLLRDNLRLSAMHARLALQMPVRVPLRLWRQARKRRAQPG
jgi:glycosyltransferase involved in cell wall biosynthesis